MYLTGKMVYNALFQANMQQHPFQKLATWEELKGEKREYYANTAKQLLHQMWLTEQIEEISSQTIHDASDTRRMLEKVAKEHGHTIDTITNAMLMQLEGKAFYLDIVDAFWNAWYAEQGRVD
jgi:hypothetical protein